ncbi:hypothetical protein JTB14_007987 [Gonioctena quinquepunctata]|nr:hypothetical protein JTB14_007987 [Gonioctena quinquepunctata]
MKCIVHKLDPEDYKKLDDFTLMYGTLNTKFGKCLVGMHEDKICFISFIDENCDKSSSIAPNYSGESSLGSVKRVYSTGRNVSNAPIYTKELQKLFPKAILNENKDLIVRKVQEIFDENAQGEVQILLKGSAFQIRIWLQLMNVKKGTTTTYEDIAKAIGHPKAVRAVSSAIARNHIAYLIPCHRVIGKNSSINKFRWGAERKKTMLRDEETMAKRGIINLLTKRTLQLKDRRP